MVICIADANDSPRAPCLPRRSVLPPGEQGRGRYACTGGRDGDGDGVRARINPAVAGGDAAYNEKRGIRTRSTGTGRRVRAWKHPRFRLCPSSPRARAPDAMIMETFPFVEDFPLISGQSSTIMKGSRACAGIERKNANHGRFAPGGTCAGRKRLTAHLALVLGDLRQALIAVPGRIPVRPASTGEVTVGRHPKLSSYAPHRVGLAPLLS